MANAEGILWGKLVYVYTSLIELLPNIVAGTVAFAVFIGGSFLADRAVTRAFHARRQYDLGYLLGGFLRWALVFFGFLVAATIIFPSVKPSDVLGALGVGSVAVGFAFKDILQNWFAGLLLLLREPFKRGDQIVIKNYEGTVEHIQRPRHDDQDLRRTPRGHPELGHLHAAGNGQHRLPHRALLLRRRDRLRRRHRGGAQRHPRCARRAERHRARSQAGGDPVGPSPAPR